VCVHMCPCVAPSSQLFDPWTKCDSPKPCFDTINEQIKIETQVRWQHWIQNALYAMFWKAVYYTVLLWDHSTVD
jgi:hypothetical protein